MVAISKFSIASLLFVTVIVVGNVYAQGSMSEPKLLSKPELQFPNEAYMGRVVGKVWLRLLVGADGIPVKTDILKRDPEMAYLFDNCARKWGMQCRFNPALDSDGKPVPMWEIIPLSFELDRFTPPECIKLAEPKYPAEAHEMGMEGWVGLAVFVKSNGQADESRTVVVAREPESTTIFERAAKDAASHSQFIAAGYEANAVEGWCFIKVPFKITSHSSDEKQEEHR